MSRVNNNRNALPPCSKGRKVPAIFFCGDQSPYGLEHLRPLCQSFDVRLVVLATHRRWKTFRTHLARNATTPSAPMRHPLPYLVAAKLRANWKRALHVSLVRQLGIPIAIVDDVNSEQTRARFRAFDADLGVCAAYPQIFKESTIQMFQRGIVNFHPSLLPKFRGAHPHYWCIATGQQVAGITSHYMEPSIDTGNIIAQIEFEIGDLAYAQLYRLMIEKTPELVARTAEFFTQDDVDGTVQDNDYATYFHEDSPADHTIRWDTMPANTIVTLVRAGAAFTTLRDTPLFIKDCEVINDDHFQHGRLRPGTIREVSRTTIACTTMDGKTLKLKHPFRRSRWTGRMLYHLPRAARIGVVLGQ